VVCGHCVTRGRCVAQKLPILFVLIISTVLLYKQWSNLNAMPEKMYSAPARSAQSQPSLPSANPAVINALFSKPGTTQSSPPQIGPAAAPATLFSNLVSTGSAAPHTLLNQSPSNANTVPNTSRESWYAQAAEASRSDVEKQRVNASTPLCWRSSTRSNSPPSAKKRRRSIKEVLEKSNLIEHLIRERGVRSRLHRACPRHVLRPRSP
jgi:hypothetical protein